MTGLVYKELRQNWVLILCTLVLPALIAYPVCAWIYMTSVAGPEEGITLIGAIRSGDASLTFSVFLLVAYAAAGAFQGMVFRGDDRKLWAMWTASTPDGVRGYIRIKYELTFVMTMLALFSLQIGNLFMEMICGSYDTQWFTQASAMVTLSYAQIIMRSIEIPFTVRFGVRNGSIIKSIILVLAAMGAIAVYLVKGESIVDAVITGDTERLGAAVQVIFACLPVIAVGGYYLSYRLSCRLYMKGVEQYDK